MKEKNFIYSVDSDVNSIELNLKNGNVEIYGNADGKFYLEYPNTKNIFAANDENGIIIHQGNCGFFIKPYQNFKIFVPAHNVPTVKIHGKNVDLYIDGGIYGDLNYSADDGTLFAGDCVFESAEIAGGDLNFHLAGATVKNGLVSQFDKGDLLIENSFLTRAEVRIKRGNAGVVNVNCKDCSFDVYKGNVTASVVGNKDNFNVSLLTKEGTVNMESVRKDDAEGEFQAYVKKGNIVLDFIGENAGAQLDFDGETPVTEEISEEEKEKENA